MTAGRWQGSMFAEFEAHTRGIGSKLLAAMGFVAGKGLGRDKQGISAALQVQVRCVRSGPSESPVRSRCCTNPHFCAFWAGGVVAILGWFWSVLGADTGLILG